VPSAAGYARKTRRRVLQNLLDNISRNQAGVVIICGQPLAPPCLFSSAWKIAVLHRAGDFAIILACLKKALDPFVFYVRSPRAFSGSASWRINRNIKKSIGNIENIRESNEGGRFMEPKYTVDITLDENDIKRFAKMLQGDQKKGYIFTAVAVLWILYAAIANLRSGKTLIGIAMLIIVIGCPLIYLYTSRRELRKNYERIKAQGGDKFTVLFYDDHFETRGEKSKGSYEYAKLHNMIETDRDFYLEVEQGQCVILQKHKCNEELSAFIRGLKSRKTAN
jgi:hypothetical protein